MREFKSTFVRDNFNFDERCILNDTVLRPNKELILNSLREDLDNYEDEEMRGLIQGLINKVEDFSQDQIKLMYDELPVEEHTGLSDQMLQARLQEGQVNP